MGTSRNIRTIRWTLKGNEEGPISIFVRLKCVHTFEWSNDLYSTKHLLLLRTVRQLLPSVPHTPQSTIIVERIACCH